jgi:NADH-quinone oxidoreductase subunit C
VPETNTSLLENKYPGFLSQFRDEILAVEDFRGDLSVSVRPARIREMAKFLKTDSSTKFDVLMDLFGMDYLKFEPEALERFAVIYIFYSMKRHEHFRLKVLVPESSPNVDSIHDVYAAVNWNEREVWDLFGILFTGHPNLIRILTHNDFVGHPLRKDYPSDQYQRLKNAAPSTGF